MTGSQAIQQALIDAGVRSAWSFPGSPTTKLEIALDKAAKDGRPGPAHEFVVSEHVGATMALAGALLDDHRTAFLCKHVGINVALDTLATAGAHSLFRSGVVVFEGLDPGPKTSQNAQDNRAALSSIANLALLEPGDPAECYAMTRYAYHLSETMRAPVVVRATARVLDAEGDIAPAPPELPEGPPRFFLPGAPIVVTAPTWAEHQENRLGAFEQVFESLHQLAPSDVPRGARRGVVTAGQLGRDICSAARARGLASLRVACTYPPPIARLVEFCAQLDQVWIIEEGHAFLAPWITFAFATYLGEGGPPKCQLLPEIVKDSKSIEIVLDDIAMLGVTGERDSGAAPPVDVAAALAALDGAGRLDDASWADAFAAARPQMKRFPDKDPRRGLLAKLRVEAARIGRPSIVVADPGNTGVLGIAEGLVDVKWHMGSAAPAAAGLTRAERIADNPGRPLAIAVIGDTNYYHSEILGIVDNGIARRDVLHVILVNRRSEMTAGIRTPYLDDDHLTRQLEASGLAVTQASIEDTPALEAAIIAAVAATGPRVLLITDDRHNIQPSDG